MDFMEVRQEADQGLRELSLKNQIHWTMQTHEFIELLPYPAVILDHDGMMCFTNSIFYKKIAQIGRLKERDFVQTVIAPSDRESVLDCLESLIMEPSNKQFKLNNITILEYGSSSAYANRRLSSSVYDWTFSAGPGFILCTANTNSAPTFALASTSAPSSSISNERSKQPSSSSSSLSSECMHEMNQKLCRNFVNTLVNDLMTCESFLDIMMNMNGKDDNMLFDTKKNITKMVNASTDIGLLHDMKQSKLQQKEDVNIDSTIQGVIYLHHNDDTDLNISYHLKSTPTTSTDYLYVSVMRIIFERSIYHLIACAREYNVMKHSEIVLNVLMSVSELKHTEDSKYKSMMNLKVISSFTCSSRSSGDIRRGFSEVSSLISTQHTSSSNDIFAVNCSESLKLLFLAVKLMGSELFHEASGDTHSLSFELTSRCTTEIIAPTIGRFSSTKELISIRKPKFLLVDDSDVCLRALDKILEKLGFDYCHASNGSEAYDIVTHPSNADSFACILMDFWMPVMDGIECTKNIRTFGYTDLPIIILCANKSSRIDNCVGAGATAVMEKPATVETLRSMLEKIAPKLL